MTDDFQLFPDQAGDDIDADIALISAYLARELSPVQIVAVEDRLAKDAAFRDKVNPILEAWVIPSPLSAVRAGQGPLSRDEVEAGWQRYVGEHATPDAHGAPKLTVESAQRKRRKISMTRIAAGIAAIVLPVFALAQVVVYVSKHESAPGHTVAKTLVEPFVDPAPDIPPTVIQPPPTPKKPLTTPVDIPVGKQLTKSAPSVQRVAPAQVPAMEAQAPSASTPAPTTVMSPDRLKIASYVNKHMPEVVRGDTTISYIVMVLDAADNYVWGTYGPGGVELIIGGDKRTPGERTEYALKNAPEYTGTIPGAGARGGGGQISRAPMGVVIVDSAGVVKSSGSSAAPDTLRRRITGTLQVNGADTIARLRAQIDTMMVNASVAVGARSGGGGMGGARAGGGGGGGRGGGRAAVGYGTTTVIDSGSYALSLPSRYAIGGQTVPLNAAAGLQDPGRGESGIQGLKATSLTMGERYIFAPGQLGKDQLRILVVHLAPGTSWTGR